MNKDQAILSFHAICTIIQIVESDQGLMAYAKAYAKRGLELSDSDSIVSQIPYIQGNIKSWKGSAARESKLRLKEILQILKTEE